MRTALLLALLLAFPARGQGWERSGDGERFVAALDGVVAAQAVTRDGEGRSTLWLLLQASEGKQEEKEQPALRAFDACDSRAPRLFALRERDGVPALVRQDSDWPDALQALASLPRADGSSTLVAYDGEAIWSVEQGRPERWLELPGLLGLASSWIAALGGAESRDERYIVTDAQGLAVLRIADGALRVERRLALPKSVSHFGGPALWSTGRFMRELLPADRGPHVIFGGAHSVDEQRYSIDRVRLPDDGEPELERCWIRTPEPEALMGQQVLRIDGREIVAMLTTRSDKIALFGEKRLRLYQPGPDRTRSGRDPLVALDTRVNLWQRSRLHVRDIDGDDNDDVTLAYWKGRRKRKAVLDTYLGVGGARLSTRPLSTTLPLGAEDPQSMRYDEDWTGDALNDWIWLAEDAVELHAGREDASGKALVEPKALRIPIDTTGHGSSWNVSIGGGPEPGGASDATGLPAIDLDGDGTLEWAYAFHDEESGKARLTIVRFRP